MTFFSDDGWDDDGFGDFGSDDDDSFGGGFDDDEDDFAKEAFEDDSSETISYGNKESVDKEFEIPEDSEWEKLVKPKAEFVDCKCNWGLFRDRNITMRKPVRIHTGENDIKMKGVVEKYDGKSTLGWWEEGSQCDAVKGQDSSTLPPGIEKEQELEIYIALMCRTIKLKYEKDETHADINTYRFIPPKNAMGR